MERGPLARDITQLNRYTMKTITLAVAAACLGLAAIGGQAAKVTDQVSNNPLLEEWDTPFGVPPFDRIESEHYLPALRVGMEEQSAEIEAIVANPEDATFENTIEALERSGGTLAKISVVFTEVDGANGDDITRETASTLAPEQAAHYDDIVLNAALFDRVNAVYERRDDLDLSAEQRRLLEHEGVRFDDGGRVALHRFRWRPRR